MNTENDMNTPEEQPEQPPQELTRPLHEAVLIEVRKWAFEKAFAYRKSDTTEEAVDTIYRAGEIEEYILTGKNPRGDFFSCVECALQEAAYQDIANVSHPKKMEVLRKVEKELIGYKALGGIILSRGVTAADK